MPQLEHSTMFETDSFMLMDCRRLVRAFDVFALGTAIKTSPIELRPVRRYGPAGTPDKSGNSRDLV